MKGNALVFYDLQRSSFYRVDKQTGKQYKSYKNGDMVRTFKPDITGINYKSRKQSDKKQMQYYAIKVKPTALRISRLSKTIDNDNPQTTISSTKLLNYSQLDRSKSPKDSMKNSTFLQTFYSTIGTNRKQNEFLETTKNIFNETIKKFSQYAHNKKQQNHSPKKDQIPSNSPQKQPIQQHCTTLKNWRSEFPKIQSLYKQHKSLHKKIRSKQLSRVDYPNLMIQKQSQRQHHLFYRLNPEYIVKQNPQSIEIAKDRKKNIKKLQKLFIKENNKITKLIYQ